MTRVSYVHNTNPIPEFIVLYPTSVLRKPLKAEQHLSYFDNHKPLPKLVPTKRVYVYSIEIETLISLLSGLYQPKVDVVAQQTT